MITILTAPSTLISYKIQRKFRDFVRKYIFRKELVKYHGHPAVVRSLLEGLKGINEKYIFNPKKGVQITDHVHVLGGLNALKYAIRLKNQGKIKRLTAGPNIVISSADHQGIIGSKEIDFYLVNSEWTKSAYLKDNPLLKNRIGIFASGVNINHWNINKAYANNKRILFYYKSSDENLYQHCKKIGSKFGYQVDEIIYGKYTHEELKKKLKSADLVVYFTEWESQGIALVEIWATDTPTLVWNPGIWSYNGNEYPCSSAPYLSIETGLFFKDKEEFTRIFKNKQIDIKNFSPKKWVKNNLTDELSATQFLKLIN